MYSFYHEISMIRQTGLAQAIDIAENRAKYDDCAKKC